MRRLIRYTNATTVLLTGDTRPSTLKVTHPIVSEQYKKFSSYYNYLRWLNDNKTICYILSLSRDVV